MNLFLWDFRTKCGLLRECHVPPGLREQLSAQHAENRALPLWSQVVEMLPCAHPCLLWHLSRRSCSLSVVQEVYSLLLGALVRSEKIQPAKQRPGKCLLPSALMVAPKIELLVASCLVFLFFVFIFVFYKGTSYGTWVKPFDRTILKSRTGKWQAMTGDWLWGSLGFWNESQRRFHLLAHRLSYWK